MPLEISVTKIIFDLLIIYASGKLAYEFFSRLKQSPVIGEILAGIILGASVLNIIKPSQVVEVMAELGIIILLFTVGLETRFSDLVKVSKPAFLVAAIGVIIPFFIGYITFILFGYKSITAIFAGAALTATSVGITARVFQDLKVINTKIARVVLAAAVIDDILGLIILAIVSGFARGHISSSEILLLLFEAILFITFFVLIGIRVIKKIGSILEKLHIRNAPLVVALIIALGLAVLSSKIGMAGIIGAFIAGLMFAETKDRWPIEKSIEPVSDFLVTFFFVNVGLIVNIHYFAQIKIIFIAIIITILAVFGKILAGLIGAAKLGLKDSFTIGIGMSPRGEVGIIVATIGLGTGIITQEIYGIILFMAMATTLMTPPILKLLMGKK